MSDSLDSLAMMTVLSNVGFGYEYLFLWYFEDEGIKRSKSPLDYEPERITYLSTKEKLRWSKVYEYLNDYFRRNPTIRKPERGQLSNFFRDFRVEMRSTLVANVSNSPGILNKISSGVVMKEDISENKAFFLILVVLSLVYGGIHLATWNFAFPSKTEHLLWKIACIDIMATVPIGVLCLAGLDSSISLWKSYRNSIRVAYPHQRLFRAIFYVLSVPYALSRFYLVVESLISLRHVPIGVYAAVPWVQAIPHV